ncbi:nesprin-2 isoform X2 [Paroedura picta]|uniref:nesprin-2 isoform X2 n=1 Tax=Paroedura picta TaxID=143630 RepID=UPI0040563CAF
MASPEISPTAEEQLSSDIDDLHYSLQAEQENTQKRTFTSWINSQLEKHSPPSAILDLYADVGKGHVLLDLLEVLSGQQLPRERGSNPFQCRSNVENALRFLKNRSIKLINIHVADIIEGNPSIVLGLIWTIILHFHIEELARTLACGHNRPSTDNAGAVGSSPTASPPAKKSTKAKAQWKMSAKKALLLWAKEQCATYGSISIADFKSSWRNGLAFLAVIHALRPDLVDMEKARGRSNKENLKDAFQIAEKELQIPRLLEPEDVDVISPDEKSIMTYVAQFLQCFKNLPVAEENMQGKAQEALSWLNAQEKKLTELLTETEDVGFYKKYQEMLSFTETFHAEKKAFLPVLASKRKEAEPSRDSLRMREAWGSLTSQINEWKAQLDRSLPCPLDALEARLQEIEQQLAEDLLGPQAHQKTMAALEGKMRSIQSWMGCFEECSETLRSFQNRDETGMLLVPPEKLAEMRRRLSNIQLVDFNILVEYYHSFCASILEHLTSKLNIWHIRYGTKESVEALLLDWNAFIEEKGFLTQLETALRICEEKKINIINTANFGAVPQDTIKLLKMVELKVSTCKEYMSTVSASLQKVLSSWAIYTENIRLLKAWLEETRKAHPKKIPTEALAAWNSRHASLNEAGNFLIEASNEEVGSALSGELQKLNGRWAKLIKKTQFEMRLPRKQEGQTKLEDGSGDAVDAPVKATSDQPAENIETLPSGLHAGSPTLETSLTEEEVKLNFEEAQKELEASVLKVMQLLGQKTSSEGQVSKYEEAFSILDAKSLGKFLKASEQWKDILPSPEKAVVEERSKDVCERWEAVHREIVSYIQLKMEIEKGKLSKIFSKLNKQLNKEKKLLNAGKTKGLVKEHEAIFSESGSLGELNTSLQVLKTLSEKMAEEEFQPQMKVPVAEYEGKKEDLLRRASAVYGALASLPRGGHSSARDGSSLSSANGEKASSWSSHDRLSAVKDSGDVADTSLEAEVTFQNGRHDAEKPGQDENVPVKLLKESCDLARSDLKVHLRTIRERVASGFTDDVKDTSCFQNKLDELQTLESKGDSLWKHFEATALRLETETEEYADTETSREELLREWNKLQIALSERMESLKAAWAFVLPMENGWAFLCGLDKQLCRRSVQQCTVTDSDLTTKQLKEMQASVASCLDQCSRLEQGCPSGGRLDPVDRQAACVMVVKYKERFEGLGDKTEAVGRTLRDLDLFLASLRDLRRSADGPEDAPVPEALQEKVARGDALGAEAKLLDEQLRRAEICLEDAEGGKTTCSEMLGATLQGKENRAVGSGAKHRVGQGSEAQAEFALRTSELLKNLQDIHDKIGKIGLREPTIPAIQQRLKSLNELKQKLNRHVAEMKSLQEMSSQLSQSKEAGEVTQRWTVMEALWKETKLSIAERQEQCAQTIELLKQYHSCKSCLASITQEQERILSQQTSYMGKENLQRIMAKVEMAKREFNRHSEDIDRINQISKNLQFQLNKMKSFEEPPFENEANVIVDRWLDINERTENYSDNLGRALALWEKLLNLSSSIDLWISSEAEKVEGGHLTEEELAELEAGLQYQEKSIEEFDRKVDEIQDLLNSTEPLLELQVIKSSLSNKMELIRKHLPNKSIPAELDGSTAELKGDLDLAKTQIGMTESLLKALSPSNTLEIFTKLEELHQRILQQKHHVTSLQQKTDCLNPDVIELNKQLQSVTDLFNSKKHIFQDHFSSLLNYLCKDFNDWFSETWMSLKECFDPLETKELLKEKLQLLRSFLTFEGKDDDICKVKNLLSQVKNYLPKATVNQLRSWVRDQEAEVQRMTSRCQVREKELQASLQQFARLEKDLSVLEGWLSLQEKKRQGYQKENGELEHVYHILLKQRESFDSLAWLASSLRQSGFSGDEVVLESTELVDRYKTLLSYVRKNLGVYQALSAEEKNFDELAQSTFLWVERVNKSISQLRYEDVQMPLEEKLSQIKEIILLRDEGDMKIQNVADLWAQLKTSDWSKALAVQHMISSIRNQWEHVTDLALECLSIQEQLQSQMEQDRQREEDIGAVLWELGEQTQELSLDGQPVSLEIQTQLMELLQEAEGLSSFLNELESRSRSLGNGAEGTFAEESSTELKRLHSSLLSRLQNMAKLLEGCDEEHQRCEELTTRLRAMQEELLEPSGRDQQQVQQNPLGQMECTLQEIVALVDSVKQKHSLLQDGMDTPQCKYKKWSQSELRWTEQEARNIHGDAVKQNNGFSNKAQTQQKYKMRETDKLVLSDSPIPTKHSSLEEGLVECQERSPKEKAPGMDNQTEGETMQHFRTQLISEEQLLGSVFKVSAEGRSALSEGSKGYLTENDNFQRSTSRSRKRMKKSREELADSHLADKTRPRQQDSQKQLQVMDGRSEVPQTTLPLMNGKVMGANLVPPPAAHQSAESKRFLAEGVSQEGLALPEAQAMVQYAEMEQKINEMKIRTAELDVALVNDQLGEIERLCTQLEKQRAEALSLPEGGRSATTQGSKADRLDSHSLVSSWDRLLNDSTTAREVKRHQLHLVNGYQESLAAVRSSMRCLSAGKDHVKTGPVEGAVFLENIQKCLASVQKERDLLNELKAQEEHLSGHLKDMDKELTKIQVEQAEQWWDKAERSLQRKALRVTAEAKELKLITSKAQGLQRSLEQQYHQRTGFSLPNGNTNTHPALLAVELQTLKHGVALLRRDAEMRTKRIWSDSEKAALENTMSDLQNQVEELEQLTPREDAQVAGGSPQAHELTNRIEEAVLWARVQGLHLNEKAALFPEDVTSQIENCRAAIREAEDKWVYATCTRPALPQLADEARSVDFHLEPGEASALGSLSLQMQTDYRDLALELTQRLQQLESQLGNRRKLFADIERVEAGLAEVERTLASDACETSTASDLEEGQAALEGMAIAVQEMESLIDERLKDFPQGLNVFEQLFLEDCLRSLRNRTKRARGLIRNRRCTVQRRINARERLSEKTTALQQDLCSPRCGVLGWKPEELLSAEEAAKSQLSGLKERALDIQSGLSRLRRYKEAWEVLGLQWDVSRLDELQSRLCKTVEGFSAESSGYQTPLNEVEAVVSSLRKASEALKEGSGRAPEASLISAKILSQRLQQARYLTQEELRLLDRNETLGAPLKEAKRQQGKNLGVKIDGLTQGIRRQILAFEEKCMPKRDLQSKLDLNLQIWKEVRAELQQPLQVSLDTHTILGEKMYCKALEDVLGDEFRAAEELVVKERGGAGAKYIDDLPTKLDELQSLKTQLKEGVATRRSALEEAYETVKCYNGAVQKAADLVCQHESLLSSPLLSLGELEESCLLPHRTQEELEAAKDEVEALTAILGNLVKPNLRPQLEKALWDLAAKSSEVQEQNLKRESHVQRCFEKYRSFTQSKEKIRADLHDIEKVVGKSLYHTPGSYKEALEQLEQSKALSSRLASAEEDLMKLRQDLGSLSRRCKEEDFLLIAALVSALWLKWLSLLKTAREWESRCEEQSQEWKSVSQEIERETIILDNLQEDFPESPKEKERSTKEELQAFLECINCYEDSVNTEEFFLRLILHRLRSILNIPLDPTEKGEGVPVVREIRVMQDRLKELHQKTQKQKEAVLSEIQDRAKASDEIDAVKNSLQDSMLLLCGVDLEVLPERTAKLEEIQRALESQKQTFEQIMDRLRIKYSEMYTIVPVEVEKNAEDCKQILQDLEEKVNAEVLKNAPHYTTDKKIEDINKGLQAIESMLQQKSTDVTKAKEIQKRIWDLLDLWHYKMNELDSEVQDIVEQDPGQAQELMDRLMIPLQQYQQASQRAERRTTQINRAASTMEASDELLRSTRDWLESTNRLLTEEAKSDSARALNKHANALQMALEDSEQKQNNLSAMYPELDELATLIETDTMVKRLNEINGEVAALQQKIVGILPLIQHLADEVEAIESEVRTMEKDVDKIKMILAPSEDTLEFSPREHFKHGQVILAHIGPMKKALREIQSYQESLRLPGVKLQPFSAFQRTKQLLKDLKTLERMTKEQNELLEPIVKEMERCEEETDALKLLLKSHSDESPTEIPLTAQAAAYAEDEEAEDIKQKIAFLCQTKEDLLLAMKTSLLELHRRHEQSELEEEESVESEALEESGLVDGGGSDRQLSKRGSLSFLPSVVEEAEDSSFHSEGESASCPVTDGAESSATTWGDFAGAADTTEKPASPEPAQLLHVCQAKVAELEGWLSRAEESLGSDGPALPMQQVVERHLAACQAMLLEIEQKVASLLEDCKDREAEDSQSLQQEAENLSQKLKDVKCNLEKVHRMLQDKYAEEQLISIRNTSEELFKPFLVDFSSAFPPSDRPSSFSRPNGIQQQEELLLKLSEQKNLVDFIEVYVEMMQPHPADGPLLETSLEVSIVGNGPPDPITKEPVGDKWQFLEEELLLKMKPTSCQFTEPQVTTKINILPKGAASSGRTPTVEELKRYTTQLGKLSQEASIQIQESTTGEVSLSLDQKLFELLLAISHCLNNMEQMLNTCVLPSEEAPVQQELYETLSMELQKLHADIGKKKDDLLKSVASSGGSPDRFSQCFGDLQAWLQLAQEATASRGKSMKAEQDYYSNFQNEIRLLYEALTEKKNRLQQSFSAMSRHGVSEQLQKINTHESEELQNFEMQTAKLRDHTERLSLPIALIHDVYKLEDVLDDLWGTLRAKQRELTPLFISEQQYEPLLRGLGDLVDLGQEKVAQAPKLKATSRQNLQLHLQDHKDFFCKLNAHMLLVGMCSKRTAPSLLQKREKFWKELVEKIKSLQQQAIRQGTHLERLLQDWIELDETRSSFCQKLEALSSSVPSVTLVEETEERLMERSGLLQQLKRNMEAEQGRYHQILKEGKKLMELTNCSELENQIRNLEDQWTSLSQKVGHELQRHETLFKLLSSYNRDSKELEKWLESAQQRVNFWKEQSLSASQDLNTVSNNIHSFLAFLKEVDGKSSLKSSVISTGNQLLLIKESDAAMLRSVLAGFEQKWADLMAQLPSIQEKLHQLLMAKLPSNEAITELITWMNHVDKERHGEASVNTRSTACQVKALLKKYKGFLMEKNFKQWVIDYVNQSLLQMTTCDVERKRYERMAFAERLGEMNLQWHRLQGSLNKKIKELEHILETVTENENRAQSLGSWLEAQSRRLALLEKPLSFIHAQNTVEECKALESHLATKLEDVDQLKRALGDCTELPAEMASRVNELDQQRTQVVNQVAALKASALISLEQWRLYDEAWEEAVSVLARAFYCSEHSKPPVITLETLRSQVENLQSLQDKTEASEEVWARLQAAGDDLKKLCHPTCSSLIDQKYKEAHKRWVLIHEELADQLQKARTSLQLWGSYADLHTEVTFQLDKHEEQCSSLLAATIPASGTMDFLKQKSKDIQKLQLGLQGLRGRALQLSDLAEKVSQAAEPAADSLLPEKLQALQRLSYLEQVLQMKVNEFQFHLLQLEDFENGLEQLENRVKETIESSDDPDRGDEGSDLLTSQVLGLTALSPKMERLNELSYKLPLGDFTAKRLQSLNRLWAQKTAMALEQCSELQDIQSDEKFLARCRKWVKFFEKMKEKLKEIMAGTLQDLEEQQTDYEVLQAEISVHQQIFNSIVSKTLYMLESGEAEDRTDFTSKLTLLKEQWQSAVLKAQQRKNEIDGLVKTWRKFKTSRRDLMKFLEETQGFIAAMKSQDKFSLYQVWNLSQDLKNKEVLLRRWQTRYALALETGEELLGIANPDAKADIQKEKTQLQDSWNNTQLQLEEIKQQLQGTIQTWESSERRIEELSQRLQEIKARIKDPLPTEHEELQTAKEQMKELEKSLSSWDRSLQDLGTLKADLAHCLLAEDVVVLQEQVRHLHRQWEELCLCVSLRKQEIEDRLNAWIVFNEKNKELCAWLVQMESKVLQSADISIEDMIDKLQKDCMDEINQFSENKLVPLKQLGDQLIKASNKNRVAEIDEKLSRINDHWQHLFDVIGGRVKKLKETFAFIQQLDKNMSNLRTWLARIESELSKPVVYDICNDQEIQKRLAEQQDLQRDIEQHSAGVESVFNICEVLLHDSDACANETECDSIQQTTRSLDRRWRNICAMSMERRMKIEETWRLWQRFLDDYSRFEDWLKTAERTAACPNSSEVAYTNAKEELKKFEAFQRQIHERLTQLELINKQYRRLARENRTDSASKLKRMVHEGNQRWDNLQKRVAAILKRLRHFTSQWDDFVGAKDSILVWLTEMDLQLTNVEHFSEGNFEDKMRQLNGFQQEITLNINKIDQLIVFGEHLIQKSEPSDAVLIEEELVELHKYCQEVFGRVSRFHQKLTSWHPGLEDEKEASENEADAEDARGVQTDPWHKKTVQEVPPSPQSLCHLVPPAAGHERSGCETPVSVDSIPLEWDHTGDVGGSSSHEDEEEEPYFSALSDLEITENPEAYLKMTTKAVRAVSGKSASEPHAWRSPEGSSCQKHPYSQGEMVRNVLPNSPETSTPFKPSYVKQLSTSSVDSIKEISGISPSEEPPNSPGLVGVAAVEKQSGVIERWDLLQAQDLSNKLRMKQNLQQWQQLNSDLANINAWLDPMEEELEELQKADPVGSMQTIEQKVKKLKEMLKAFDNYKALVLSVNLTSRDFKQADSTESKELQNRLRRVNLRWEKANHLLGTWRKSLQESLMRSQDFHEVNQKLLLWLAGAETRRHRAQVKDPNADPHVIQESRKELMQLEKELLERQPQVHTLQEISTYLLARSDGGKYAEADEKVHVIGKKLKQLLEGVSCDLKTARSSQDISAFLPGFDELDSGVAQQQPEIAGIYKKKVGGTKKVGSGRNQRVRETGTATPPAPETPSFFHRMLRAALPLQLLLLLLLLLAFLIPSSEEDYSCTQANNFARSLYPMLHYINGPPPT